VDWMKRCIDIILSSLLLLLLSPVLAAAALMITLDSRGSIIFRQERVGRSFRRFRIMKFRTMRSDKCGAPITTSGDQRVTRVGSWLRATKIDELPQLVNVLRGEMSLVGPRPEIPEYVELFRDRFQKILQVRPGITDPASIAFRNEEEILSSSPDPLRTYRELILPAKLDLSEQYLRERSLGSDLLTLLKTATAIFFRNSHLGVTRAKTHA
jgi:lipopolysaccharide/colanic/teichoic acid biosynthesis glycosyltransferase